MGGTGILPTGLRHVRGFLKGGGVLGLLSSIFSPPPLNKKKTLGTGHRMDKREPQSCFYRVHWVGVATTTLVLFSPFASSCGTATKMASEITERTGKPKDKIKNASKVIRTDIFMEELQKYVFLYDKYSRP